MAGATCEQEGALAAGRAAALACTACPLWQLGRQTVFGEGPADARLLLCGEAPGEQEDREGRPFVGPAGRLLDQALEQAGLDRRELYITNLVKHRPWVEQGGRRRNRPPRASEIRACAPWLQQELSIIRPDLVLCLGAPAARAIISKEFKLTEQRGRWYTLPSGARALATLHPAYVLIQPEASFDRLRAQLVADLRLVAEAYRALPPRLPG